MQAIRCLVVGRVQGVFFRSTTVEQAQRLGLDGWAKNLVDGRVEIVARGDPDALAELAAWLWQGPPRARVDSVTVEEWSESVADGFVVAQ